MIYNSLQTPLISIITVSFNSEQTISETFHSVLSQTHSNFEIIVIDGQSTDKTPDIIKEYAGYFDGRMKWVSEPDKGLYDALNKGLTMAKGEIIGFLHSDDFFVSDHALEQIVIAFNDSSKPDACYFDIAYIEKDSYKLSRLWVAPPNWFSKTELGWFPEHTTLFVRKEIYQKYGLFNLDYKIAADIDMLSRLFSNKIATAYVPKIFSAKREGGLSNKSLLSIINGNRESFRALRQNGVFPYLIFIKPLRKLLYKFYARLFYFSQGRFLRNRFSMLTNAKLLEQKGFVVRINE